MYLAEFTGPSALLLAWSTSPWRGRGLVGHGPWALPYREFFVIETRNMQYAFYYCPKSLRQHALRWVSFRQHSLGYSSSMKPSLPLRFRPRNEPYCIIRVETLRPKVGSYSFAWRHIGGKAWNHGFTPIDTDKEPSMVAPNDTVVTNYRVQSRLRLIRAFVCTHGMYHWPLDHSGCHIGIRCVCLGCVVHRLEAGGTGTKKPPNRKSGGRLLHR